MAFAVPLALLVAQATPLPSPSATTCLPTEVKRVRPKNAPDPEFRGHDSWCKGISCFVVDVVVTVNPDGTVKSAVERGSWGVGTDYAVMRDARNSNYIPATVDCKPVEGTYIFREMFTRVD